MLIQKLIGTQLLTYIKHMRTLQDTVSGMHTQNKCRYITMTLCCHIVEVQSVYVVLQHRSTQVHFITLRGHHFLPWQ